MPRKDPDARREYNREYQRRWYQQNRELQKQRVLKATRMRRERGKAYVDAIKSQPCADCGVQYPPYGSFIQANRLLDGDPFWIGIFN